MVIKKQIVINQVENGYVVNCTDIMSASIHKTTVHQSLNLALEEIIEFLEPAPVKCPPWPDIPPMIKHRFSIP